MQRLYPAVRGGGLLLPVIAVGTGLGSYFPVTGQRSKQLGPVTIPNVVRCCPPLHGATIRVMLRCSLQLSASDVITRRIVLEGPDVSGVVIACDGATIGRGGQTPAEAGRFLDRAELTDVRSLVLAMLASIVDRLG
jgi:hypothetical protein